MDTIALQSFNFPDRFVRHSNFLAELTPVVNDLDKQDATFFWHNGLADVNLVSFQSLNFNTRFLRHQDFRVKLHEQDLTFDANHPAEETPEQKLFRADATFVVVPGLADVSGLSFRSFNFPDRFLRHRDFHLFVESVTGDVGQKDATFRIVRGFVPAPPPPK
jgi:Alpha-L-arabinofuranosidase B (ABFB) domain